MPTTQPTLWALFILERHWEEESCLGMWGGKNKIDCRSTSVTMLLYGCFSCAFIISLLLISLLPISPFDLWMVWPVSSTGLYFGSSACCAPSDGSFDVTLPPSPPGQDPQPPLASHIAAWGCSCSSPQSHQPSLSEVSTGRTSSPIPTSSCWECLGKEHLTLTLRAALLPPCLGHDGWPLSRQY